MHDLLGATATVTRRVFDVGSVLYLNGRFDFTNIRVFESQLRDQMHAGAIVSLERTSFLDCSVLSALIRLQRAAAGKLVIVVPPALPSARVFAVTQAATFLRVVQDRAAAFELSARLLAPSSRP